MQATCHNDLPQLAATECHPLQAEVNAYVANLLATLTPDLLEEDGRFRLVVGSRELAVLVRNYLQAQGHTHVDVLEACPAHTSKRALERRAFGGSQRGNYTPTVAVPQQPRRNGAHTKAQPSAKARKASRKQARAGRKASR